MLRRIVNLRYPDQLLKDGGDTPELQEELIRQTRSATKSFWPELWEEDLRATEILRVMRDLLQRFWKRGTNTQGTGTFTELVSITSA